MSKLICGNAIEGAREVVARAVALTAQAIDEKGSDFPVAFPATAYYLPVIYSFTGRKVEKLADLTAVLQDCHNLLPQAPSDRVWLPYLGDALDAGAATLFAFEVIEACKTVMGPNPVDGIWLGAANDVIMRERGIEFVDGTAPGFAAVVGAAPDSKTAVRIARELQEKNLYVFMAGSVAGETFAEQLASEGVQLGWETRLVPFGRDVSAAIYALGFANRAALSFGGVAPGDFERNLRYNKNRIFAFVLALGEVDDEKYAAAAGAINYGFPTIADTDIPEILPTGVCTYEHVVSNVPYDKIVEKALEVRGCKVKVAKVPIPVAFGPAFEGERIRKADTHVEFGGNITPGFEFVHSVNLDDIEDGVIEILGPDIDTVDDGAAMPLAIWVEVAGRKMQPDFEPVLERQIHHLVNSAEGIWHMGQRDIIWTRVSKAAYAKGFRLKHYGEILHAKFINDYPAIVDKVKVTLITDRDEVEHRLAKARRVYVDRNHRLASMTDESVDTFYSCLLCQSFAPDHVCIITPERLGLCGAYNWLDGKAAFEIDTTGPNQPVEKGRCLDSVRGIWEGVNDYVYKNSHKKTSLFTAYSLMSHPMTSCGCFEAIIAYVPECNGVMIVNREFLADTPVGMTFSTLAGMVGGGIQTPGFMGVGKAFLVSPKFLAADGGMRRIVWMPSELKRMLADDFEARIEAEGLDGFWEMIADETVATDPHDIRAFLDRVHHPATTMPAMESIWENAPVLAGESLFPHDHGGNGDNCNAVEKPQVSRAPITVEIEAKKRSAPPTSPDDHFQAAGAHTSKRGLGCVGPLPGVAYSTAASTTPQTPPHAPAPSNVAPQNLAQESDPVGLMAALFEQFASVVAQRMKESLAKEVSLEVKAMLKQELRDELHVDTNALKVAITSDIANSLLRVLHDGAAPNRDSVSAAAVEISNESCAPPKEAPQIPERTPAAPARAAIRQVAEPAPNGHETQRYSTRDTGAPRTAAEKLGAVQSITIPRDQPGTPIQRVRIGATRDDGGTRRHTLLLGGQNCMPFHHFEGSIPHAPALALEVFDTVSTKLSSVLRDAWGDLLYHAPEMAKRCVSEFGADAISVRLEGTHPEKGGKSPDEALALVKAVLEAVDVPLIITGHSHCEATNAIMKTVAAGCEGERLLLNWVEGENYRTIAGAALAYGHCVVAQTPIDVNLAKQLNILLTNMQLPRDRIVMDPMAGALGYGL